MNFNMLQSYKKPITYLRFKCMRNINLVFYKSPIYSCAACGRFL
jgi:hypothetical protein